MLFVKYLKDLHGNELANINDNMLLFVNVYYALYQFYDYSLNKISICELPIFNNISMLLKRQSLNVVNININMCLNTKKTNQEKQNPKICNTK